MISFLLPTRNKGEESILFVSFARWFCIFCLVQNDFDTQKVKAHLPVWAKSPNRQNQEHTERNVWRILIPNQNQNSYMNSVQASYSNAYCPALAKDLNTFENPL